MRRNAARLSWVFLAGLATAQAHEEGHEHGAHEHGIGRLDIAVEKNSIDIDLDSPAINLIGFEHAPGDAQERTTLNQAVTDLKQGGGLIAFSPSAQCTQQRVKVSSGLLDQPAGAGHDGKEDHDHDAGAGHDHDDEDEDGDHEHGHEHADIEVTWELTCVHPENLHEADFTAFFHRFPGTHTLRVQAALTGGQTAAELTPAAAKLKM
jgi:hypothetical protein